MKSIGKYQVIEQLGASAAGTTYRVRDSFRNREFALKVLQTVPGLTSEAKEQFCAHLASCAELVHRHVVKVHDLGEVDEGVFVVSEWRNGIDLGRYMQENRDLPLGQKLALIAQVAEGLAFANSREIAHGDLKPSNVFVDGARDVTILDFGIAKWLAALLDAGCRPEGLIVNYLAPEQVLGEPFDARTDIFALGLMLYEFISGKYPFAAAPGLIPREIVHTQVEPLRLFDPHIPEQLDLLVQRSLVKDPLERLQTAEEFAAGLYLAAQEIRRQASASALAAPAPPATEPVEPAPAETPAPAPEWVANQSTAFASPGAPPPEPPQRAPEQPVRERPQDAAKKPEPWTARSYAASGRLTRETLAPPPPARTEPQSKPDPAASAPAASSTPPPAAAAPPPVIDMPIWAPQPTVSPLQPPPVPAKTTSPRRSVVTKRAIAVLVGLILAAVIVSSFLSRKSLQASPNKNPVPVVVAQPAPITKPATAPVEAPREPEAAQPGDSGPNDVGNPEFSARETLHGPVRTLWESGRYAEALALVNQVLANNPKNAEARTWKKKIRDAQAAEAALK